MKKLLLLIALALVAALYPFSPELVEREYSQGVYPKLQSAVTTVTNEVPFALLDLALGLILVVALIAFVRVTITRGLGAAFGRAAVWLLASLATVYLLFLASWGLNYRRVPLEATLDFDRTRISEAAAVKLAAIAVERLNAGHAAAHAVPFRTDVLANAFSAARNGLGPNAWIEPGVPKPSLLQAYFRQAAIDGMTVPVFLEVILNPDLLEVERPFTLAHEWAHLAGYADESEANFYAWVVCVNAGDPLLQYSGWLDAYTLAVNALPREARRAVPQLADGPRRDLAEIAARYGRASPRVRRAARGAYDSYLKANRVEEGIESYAAALQLMLGTRFQERWMPALRSR